MNAGGQMDDRSCLRSPRPTESRLVSFRDAESANWTPSDGRTDDHAHVIQVEGASRTPSASPEDNSLVIEDDSLPDLGFLYEGKSILKGSPVKPTIMSGNALHLHMDEEDSPPSLRFAPDRSAPLRPQTSDTVFDAPHLVRPIAQRVRFRSRVRIASGLHRHRKDRKRDRSPSTSESSASTSPCSSISAPLRYQVDDSSAFGPLGKRLSSYAATGGWKNRILASPAPQRPDHRRSVTGGDEVDVTERTSLLVGSRRRIYPGEDVGEGLGGDDVSLHDPADTRTSDEDVAFGPWPRRLLNHRWWWWQFEPLMCCLCADDSDTDD